MWYIREVLKMTSKPPFYCNKDVEMIYMRVFDKSI